MHTDVLFPVTAPAHRLARVGPLTIDLDARTAGVHGATGAIAVLALTPKEFELLRALAADPTRLYTKAELLRTIWGYPAATSTRTLDTHASRLRRKLYASGAPMLVTVWGVGYRLRDPW